MKSLIGEYDCKLDAKGRFMLPADLRKQLPEDQQADFVVNRGLDKCLVIYPLSVWDRELEHIQSRNFFLKDNRAFKRMYLNGARKVSLDGNARFLLPKRLMEFAELKKEIVLVSQIDRIEIWDTQTYQDWLDNAEVDFEALAEKVMGDIEE
ncbi:MAG: division/cell wall cluster transcriptional repressor MraZ [Bacteroidota bacterium]